MTLVVPPSYCDVLPHCAALIERAKHNPASEVEGKLGFFDARGGFDSGVPLQTFNKLLVRMDSATAWDRVVEWRDSQDFFFEGGLRGTQASDGDAEFINKQLIEHLNLRAPERTLALRISCKVEAAAQPITAYPHLVRIKKRKEYHYREFVFCFTYVFQDKTVAEAQAKQPRYEIEVECTNLQHPKGSEYLALSLLMKLGDLLDQQSSPMHLEVI
jgi:hypothetical protein